MIHSRDGPKEEKKMKNKAFLAGLLLGALVFGGTTAYAAGVVANLSTQPIYVDGQQVSMTAYSIGGNNYVKLRDIGKAVGFNVYWNNGVQIDSDAAYTGAAPTQASDNNSTAVIIPQSDAKLTLKVGDTVQCDDGTTYAITDMSRYDSSAFSAGPLGALPTATCDWSSFPTVGLPEAEARHIQNSAGDYLFIRNLYESRRMQYTIQNLAGNDPQTSENGKLKYDLKGTPYVRIQLSIDADKTAQSFWPWKESELTDQFKSCPIGTYQMEAWDVYLNGAFQYTEYLIYAL